MGGRTRVAIGATQVSGSHRKALHALPAATLFSRFMIGRRGRVWRVSASLTGLAD